MGASILLEERCAVQIPWEIAASAEMTWWTGASGAVTDTLVYSRPSDVRDLYARLAREFDEMPSRPHFPHDRLGEVNPF